MDWMSLGVRREAGLGLDPPPRDTFPTDEDARVCTCCDSIPLHSLKPPRWGRRLVMRVSFKEETILICRVVATKMMASTLVDRLVSLRGRFDRGLNLLGYFMVFQD